MRLVPALLFGLRLAASVCLSLYIALWGAVSDELGATGGANGDAFMLAVTRASEICIGIVCAGVVLAATDFGGARRRLATVLATLTRQITNGFVEELVTGARLALHARGSVLALSEVLDQHAPYFGAAAPA